jgi:class 3 adenylate cyclase
MGIATGAVGIAAAGYSVVRYLVKKEQMEGDLKRLQERYDELDSQRKDLLQMVGGVKAAGTAALLLKSAIDTELEQAMKVLEATASSILVPLPAPEPANLIFLSIHGPAAQKLRRATLSVKKGIAGFVFSKGRSYLAVDARGDKEFFKGIDTISDYNTKDLLCVPVRSDGEVAGVMQFLNKAQGAAFGEQDLRMAERFAGSVAPKVVQFVAEPRNFELLGFSSEQLDKDGTVIFCDLTASSLLVDAMDFTSAISLMNAYLERSCDVALKFGGTIDKLLGDGAMLRFNVPHPVDEYKKQAVRAALEMRHEFDALKQGWLDGGLPARELFTRIGIASGRLREAIMGHPQFQSMTVMGEPVIVASGLCSRAPRDHSVILIDDETLRGMERELVTKPVPQALLKKLRGSNPTAYEVIESARR